MTVLFETATEPSSFARSRDVSCVVCVAKERGYPQTNIAFVWASVLTCALLGVLVGTNGRVFLHRQGRDCLTMFWGCWLCGR